MRLKRTSRSDLTISSEDRATLYTMNLELFGERLRRARVEKKLSQRDLCAGLFTSAYLSTLELGKTRPTFETLYSLAERLDKSVDFFLRPLTGLLYDLDQEQASIMGVRLALLTAQTALEKGADARVEKALAQVALYLVRLSSTEKAHYYYLRGKFNNKRNDPLLAVLELEEARRHVPQSDEPLLPSQIETELGQTLYHQGRPRVALTHYQAALAGLDTPTEGARISGDRLRWQLMIKVANCHLGLGNAAQVSQVFQEALERANITTNLEKQAEENLAEASSYGEKGDYQRASLHLGRTQQIYAQLQDQRMLLHSYNRLAELQFQLGQYPAAEARAKLVLKMVPLTQLSEGNDYQIEALVTLANIRHQQHQLNEAKGYIEEALKLSADGKSERQLGRLYQVAAEIMAELSQRAVAEGYYRQAIVAVEAKEATSEQLAEIYRSYGQRLREWGEIERAFDYLEKAYQEREREHSQIETATS